MVEFLSTTGISFHLENLINNAKERIILISPYLKLNNKITELITDKNNFKIDIRIIYGKRELQPEETEKINKLSYVRLSFCEHLHAKCYMNETEAIVTSMNLYEFSQQNNYEMGFRITKEADPQLFSQILDEAQRIIRSSDEIKVSIQKVKKGGFCIRCGKEIKLDQSHPYCLTCYSTWKNFSNPDYEEKFCHECGKANSSSMTKPICKTCFKKK